MGYVRRESLILVTCRLTKEDTAKLEEIASKERRSRSNIIEGIISDYVKNLEEVCDGSDERASN